MNELINQARKFLNQKRAAKQGRTVMPGTVVVWEGEDGKARGPAVIEGVFDADGEQWVWVTYAGEERLLNAKFIRAYQV